MKQFTFQQEGVTGFYPSSKILLVLYSCEQLLIIHITYQSTYFTESVMQGSFKYPRIMKIRLVHQKLQNITFLIILLNLFSICTIYTPNW